ncbi:MAG: thioredoxin family protein [Chitinophagaceae bacterium]|nr:MAG: thioredoxin family protein [Chitinophagaceae bacterium]
MRALLFFCLFACLRAGANDSTLLYRPAAPAEKDIAAALLRARAEKKHVLLQVGGNWCVSCYSLHSFLGRDSVLRAHLAANYVVYHLNYSTENRNEPVLRRLGYPQRFGFPVLVVLDARGDRLHTQDISLLMKGNGYDRAKLFSFLRNWAPGALDPMLYQ